MQSSAPCKGLLGCAVLLLTLMSGCSQQAPAATDHDGHHFDIASYAPVDVHYASVEIAGGGTTEANTSHYAPAPRYWPNTLQYDAANETLVFSAARELWRVQDENRILHVIERLDTPFGFQQWEQYESVPRGRAPELVAQDLTFRVRFLSDHMVDFFFGPFDAQSFQPVFNHSPVVYNYTHVVRQPYMNETANRLEDVPIEYDLTITLRYHGKVRFAPAPGMLKDLSENPEQMQEFRDMYPEDFAGH